MKLLVKLFFALFFFSSFLYSQELLKRQTNLVADGKAVMFIFDSKTCSYCEILKKDFKSNKKMNTLAKNFNIYLIDKDAQEDYVVGKAKKKENTTTLRMAFMVQATPSIIMFDKNWNKIFQVPGYASPKQMSTFMTFVLGVQNGKYKLEDWQKYIKESGV